MEKWYIFTYIHQKKKINQKIHHPNVGKYTIFPMDHMATSHPTYTSNPPSRSKSPLTWPVVRPAARNGCASARRFGGFVGGHDSVLWPAPTKPGKNRPKKHVFIIFCWENWRSNWIWVGVGYVLFKNDVWYLMNWWFDTLMIGEGWWVMGNDEEEIVHMYPYVWF